MKTACIYHNVDLDGWMSAAIVKHWSTEHVKIYKSTSKDYLDFIGYDYGQSIPDLSGYDKVIMVDISFPKEEIKKLNNKSLLWLDHHISAIKEVKDYFHSFRDSKINNSIWGIRDINYAACELTWKFLSPNEPMPEIVRLIGRYDCFGGIGTINWKDVLEFQYGVRSIISSYEDAYIFLQRSFNSPINKSDIEIIKNEGRVIYKYLCTEAKQLYKNGVVVTFSNITILEEGYNFICINRQRLNLTDFGIDYHKDGYDGCASFYYDGSKWCFSLYNDNGLVDCSIIAKQYGGGGNKWYASFIVKDINDIINL